MASPGDINRQSSSISNVADAIRREKNKNDAASNDSMSWWTGPAADTNRSSYSAISQDVGRLISKLDTVRSQMDSLSSAVQRADDARREEQRRLAAAAAAAALAKSTAGKK